MSIAFFPFRRVNQLLLIRFQHISPTDTSSRILLSLVYRKKQLHASAPDLSSYRPPQAGRSKEVAAAHAPSLGQSMGGRELASARPKYLYIQYIFLIMHHWQRKQLVVGWEKI